MADAQAAEAIVSEAAGHPFFLGELVRHARASGGVSVAHATLGEVFAARIEKLEPTPRRILEALSVAGIALEAATVITAAGVAATEYGAYARSLRIGHLVRAVRREGEDAVEVYHDRVRDAVLAGLADDARKQWHGRVALALEGADRRDDDALAAQWLAAGERQRALFYTLAAAEQAARALAFDRAAQLYETASGLFEAETPERQATPAGARPKRSAIPGAGADAAEAFADAADHCADEAPRARPAPAAGRSTS